MSLSFFLPKQMFYLTPAQRPVWGKEDGLAGRSIHRIGGIIHHLGNVQL